MTPDPKKKVEEQLMDDLLEFILEAPEEEFLQYLKDSGEDPVALAREGREGIAAALKRHGQAKLAAARRDHSQQSGDIERFRDQTPPDLEGKQLLLAQLLAQLRTAGHSVSFQNRDFKRATPEDLDDAIQKLRALLVRNSQR
jgi:tRNA/tmRNA/rRNA uracil-C5-methylase (TrmA/RlmC/RlmD family)